MLNSTYNILEELGKGQFGIVYKGVNIHTKEEVAIKVEKKDTKLLKRESNIYAQYHSYRF
jgi:serine/threonine protein kinase